MKRYGLLSMVFALGVLGTALLLFTGQEAAGKSDDSWRQLALRDFVREIERITSAAEPVSDAVWAEIRSQSAERLLQAIAAGTGADYGDLVSLYLWARPVLTPDETTTVLAGLEPPANQVRTWTYDQMRGVHLRMNEAGMPVDAIHALTLAWLENRNVGTIANVDQLGWLFAQVQLAHRKEMGRQAFTVRWSGSIQPPADGAYTLSICPLALNFRSGQTFRDQTTKIFVADQPVLDSTENGWTYAARPVTLAAGRRTPLRIEFSFACSSSGVVDAFPAVALLYWEGPGMARQLVPSTALVTPDGSQSGLQGAYAVQTGPSPVSMTRVDAQLNFVWYHQCFVVSPLADVRSQLADQLYAVASDPSTLARWEHEPGTNPEQWQAHWALLESLDVTRHQRWAQLLAAHPALLEDCANWAVASVYSRCRIGAPDEALQVIGLWAQLHSDEPPVLAVDFYLANRRVYRELSRQMVSQYPAHLDRFDQDYLVLPDGRCSLPVAHTLAYGYWVAGRMEEWVDRLSRIHSRTCHWLSEPSELHHRRQASRRAEPV